MKNRPRTIFVISLLIGYVILQFLWWEYLLVKQSGEIINEKQKIIELTYTDTEKLKSEIENLHHKKKLKIYMIAGEGTVFLLLLLFGIHRIRKYYEKEEQLVSQQKNFLLSVTHELKTPIAATKLQLQTLIKHQQLHSEQKDKLLLNALAETNRLNKLIEDVLLANTADKNELMLNKERVNISELTQQVMLNYFANKIHSNQLKLSIVPDIYLNSDKLLFPSMIINLVENAFKYSEGNPEVNLEIKQEEGKVAILVSDNGIGIEDKDREMIFEKFYRVGNEEVRKTKGTGLGLYIVKKITEAHNGIIEVKPNKPKGSVFKILL